MDIYNANYYSDQFMNTLIDSSSIFEAAMQKITKRKSKTIDNKEDIGYLLSIDHSKACEKDTIMDLFAAFGNTPPKYNPYDIITIPPKSYGGLSNSDNGFNLIDAGNSSTKKNKNAFTTTVGLWIFNRSFIEPFSDVLGYINHSITKGSYGDINKDISYALLEDKINTRQLKGFIIQSQILMSCCSALAPSHTEAIFDMQESIDKKKAELEKKYKKELEAGDLVVMKKMENELIDYAKGLLEGDESRDMYDSGARSNYSNNFKNMYVMRAGIKQTDGSVKIVTSSYIGGIKEKDYVTSSDGSVLGPYNKSKAPATGGYQEKQINAAVEHIKTPKEGSDCGSDKTIRVLLTKKNAKDWYYSFIRRADGSLVEFIPDIADKYIGKTVQFRYSAMCKAKNGQLCEACCGTLFRRIGIDGVGLTTMKIGSAIKNSAIKHFHDTNINLYGLNVNKIFNID